MTAKAIVNVLNKESIRAIAHFINLIGAPIIISIGGIAINQFNTIIKNQDKMFATLEIHQRALQADTTSFNHLFRNDQLIVIRQDAAIHALKINSIIGQEFDVDYQKKYEELFTENKFLNP